MSGVSLSIKWHITGGEILNDPIHACRYMVPSFTIRLQDWNEERNKD